MKSDPYEPPENGPEVEATRDFVPKSDWHIRIVYLLPTILFIFGAVVLRGILTLSDLKLRGVSLPITWIIFGALALPASIYTANYYRQRDRNSLGTMIVMICIHFVQHAFILFGAAIILMMFS